MSGSGGGGGYAYQAGAIAYVAAHILAHERLAWIEHETPDIPAAVEAETGGAGDDLCLTLNDGTQIELQAKHGLQKGKLFDPLIKLGQGILNNPQLYGVLLTDSTASRTIRENLRNDLKRLGQGRTDQLKSITQEVQQKFASENLPTTDPEFFRRLVIIVLDLDKGLQDGKPAQLLLSRILSNHNQSGSAWEQLRSEGANLISNRGRRDAKGWANLLSNQGIQLVLSCISTEVSKQIKETEYLETIIKKFHYWWRDPAKYVSEITESTWREFGLFVKASQSEESNLQNAQFLPLLAKLRPVLEQHVREKILIVGKPGAGKTTFLHQVFWVAARNAHQDPKLPIPVLIKLEPYSHETDILELIRAAFEKHNFLIDTLKHEKLVYIKKLIRDGRLLLLIDGINEASTETIHALKEFCDRDLAIILTTRDVSAGALGVTQKLEIEPLRADEVQQFFSDRLPDHQNRVKELCDRVQDFGQTPLMVWMLYSIFHQNPEGKTPKTRGEAYRRFVTGTYVESIKQGIDLTQSRSQLSQLAFEMTRSESPTEQVVKKWLGAEEDLKHLLDHHLLQWEGNPGSRTVKFCHQSLQEYFAAEYLYSKIDILLGNQTEPQDTTFQTDYLNYLKWTEAIALMLGFREVSDDQALRVVQLALDVDLMLGARLAGEVRPEIQEQTIELISTQSPHKLEGSDWLYLELLGRTYSRLALPRLKRFLDHEDVDVARQAATWLSLLGYQESIPALCQMLSKLDKWIPNVNGRRTFSDKTISLEVEIIEALARLSPQDAVLMMRKNIYELGSLKYSFNQNRINRFLQEFDLEATQKDALQILENSEDQSQISQAAKLLFELGCLNSSSILISRLSCEPNSEIFHCFIESLGLFDTWEATFALAELLSNPHSHIRKRASETLIKYQRFNVINQLIIHLENSNWDIKWCTAVTLGKLGSHSAIQVLIDGLTEQSPRHIRQEAVEALGYIKNDEVIPYLISSLKDPDYAVRRSAAISLAQFNRDEAISELFLALYHYRSRFHVNHSIPLLIDDKIYDLNGMTEEDLKKLGDEKAVYSWFHEISNTDIKKQVAIALTKFKTEEVVERLFTALRQGIKIAAFSLGILGKQEVVPDLLEILQYHNLICSSREIIEILANFISSGNLSIVTTLISILRNINDNQYRDFYFRNRVALVLAKSEHIEMPRYLPELTTLLPTEVGEQALLVIIAIRSRCGFYNYEIYQQAKKEKNHNL